MNCMEKLANIWQQNNSMVCVGLDPDLGKLPECVKNAESNSSVPTRNP